jgi:alpha-mannosidase
LLTLERAFQTDAVERNQKPLPLQNADGLTVEIHPHEILTIRLEGKSKTLPAAE